MSRVRKFLGAVVPAVVTLGVGAALWAGVEGTRLGLVGWVLVMVVVGTAAGVWGGGRRESAKGRIGEGAEGIQNSECRVQNAGGGMRGVLGAGAVAGGMFLICLCVCAYKVGFWAGVRVGVVAGSWVFLWGVVAWGLRRWGVGVSVGVALGLAGMWMAMPVAAMPLVRAAHGGSGLQRGMVEVVGRGCPFFGLMSGLGSEGRVDWGVLPGMYKWSGLGQEVPLEMPGAWGCGAVYAGLAVGVWVVAYFTTGARR